MAATTTTYLRRAWWTGRLAAAVFLTICVSEGAGAAERPKDVSWPATQVWRQPQGLPQNSVFCLLQTRDGYLWIGTRGGVSRFDGVRFTTFEEGRGSTVHFTIRAGVATKPKPQRAPNVAAAAVTSKRILLVEDNRVNQRVAVAMLELDGHVVTVVDNGEAGVAAAKEHIYDCILMDVQMPVMSGYDATEAIRTHERTTGTHVPIIAMTAHAMQGDREHCLAAGMDAYVPKPLMPAAVRQAIAAAVPSPTAAVLAD